MSCNAGRYNHVLRGGVRARAARAPLSCSACLACALFLCCSRRDSARSRCSVPRSLFLLLFSRQRSPAERDATEQAGGERTQHKTETNQKNTSRAARARCWVCVVVVVCVRVVSRSPAERDASPTLHKWIARAPRACPATRTCSGSRPRPTARPTRRASRSGTRRWARHMAWCTEGILSSRHMMGCTERILSSRHMIWCTEGILSSRHNITEEEPLSLARSLALGRGSTARASRRRRPPTRRPSSTRWWTRTSRRARRFVSAFFF